MEKQYDNFVFYKSWWEIIKTLPADDIREIIDTLCRYVFEGTEPTFSTTSPVSMAVQFIRNDIDADKGRYEGICKKRSEAGKKGNEKRWKSQDVASIANATDATEDVSQKSQTVANIADKDNRNKDKDIVITHDVRNNGYNSASRAPLPPTGGDGAGAAKEKIILDYALHLLSQGRPNAYTEAAKAYEYYDSADWTATTTRKDGTSITRRYTNRLARLKSRTADNDILFRPEEGEIMARIVASIGLRSKNIIDDFRGIARREDTVIMSFVSRSAVECMAEIFNNDTNVNAIISRILQKKFPGVVKINFFVR